MRRLLDVIVLGAAITVGLSACGDGDGTDHGMGPTQPASFIGTTGIFAAWVDPVDGDYSAAPTASYAGKKQILHGTVDFMTGANLSEPAGIEVYKYRDGHIHALDLLSFGAPAAQQLSSESAATIDDTCTLSGTAVALANYDYVGVLFAPDLQTPTDSSYFYRLPGPDGICNTADDVIHMVRTGMSATDAPITAFAMPIVAVRSSLGALSGFVASSGASLVLVDRDFANPIVLGTFSAPIGVAVALPVGTTQGYPSGQLFVVDGSIYFVDYVAHTVSAPLYAIPNWTPTNPEALFAASATTLYFAINTPAAGATPASAAIYAMPANGTAAPIAVDNEPGRVATLLFPIQGASPIWGVVNPTYTIRTFDASGTPTTLATSTQNGGSFIATASTVYYETWTATTNATTLTVTRTGTQSGIVGTDGTVVQGPLVNSTFVSGGEQAPWPADTTTTATAYTTLFQVRGLAPVTVSSPVTGYTYTEDGVSGGSLVAIDAATNQVVATVGTLPISTATTLSGTFRGPDDIGFLQAATPVSTQNPTTQDLYLLSARTANNLTRVTTNL